ncbi:MAG: hypothetical protein JWM35_1125 [Verrucomicrobia bacterium]|nr:hypothetical protein [Verrucomicrobiota bacterium]
MIKKILLVIALVVVALLITAAFKSPDFRITRSAVIPAPPSAVFAQINDLHQWQAWSPWEKLDPAMTRTFSGPAAGVGAIYEWAGNSKVGSGRMTITESRAPELIKLRLDFHSPMESTCDTVFDLKPEGNGTAVSWTMSGKNNFVARLFCMFMNMDKVVGGEFENGLANLQKTANPR